MTLEYLGIQSIWVEPVLVAQIEFTQWTNMLSLFRGSIILNTEQAAVSWRFEAADGGLPPQDCTGPSKVSFI
jgi:hypothetical protein